MALIKCSECGKEVSDKAKSCPNCGKHITKKILCKECGKELGVDDSICSNCGCRNKFKKEPIIIFSVALLVIMILLLSPKKLQENLWYADEEGEWTYKFSNGDLYYNWDSGRTSIIGTYNVDGNKIHIQEDKGFGASYTCLIKSSKKIVCECDKKNYENCVDKTYIVAE